MEVAMFILRHYQFVVTFLAAGAYFVVRLPRRKYYYLWLLGGLLLMFGNASLWKSDIDAPIFAVVLLYFSQYVLFFLTTWRTFDITFQTALFCSTGAYALQHLAYKIHDILILHVGYGSSIFIYVFAFFAVYAIIYFLIYLLIIRRMQLHGNIHCSNLIIGALCVFVIMIATYFNLYFGRLAASVGREVYTLFNIIIVLVCALVLFLLYSIYHSDKIYKEKDILQTMVDKESERFELMKETIEIVNIKCHDLKHQIHGLNQGIPQDELHSIEENIGIYDNIAHSGNKALDIILSEKNLICRHNKIEFTYIADGAKLNFMKDAEIYALFGNILDNAVNAVMALEPEMRVINMSVRETLGFVCIHTENYFVGELEFENGLPKTTQTDEAYHGFGMKSIRTIARRYGGDVAVNIEDNLFKLDVTFKQ